MIWDSGFLGFEVEALGGLGFRVEGVGFRVSNLSP